MDNLGIIHQINRQPFYYTQDYIKENFQKSSNEFQKRAIMLYAMRYGFVVASNGGKIPESVLDFGFGSGGFLEVCKESGCCTYGYDIVKTKKKRSFIILDHFGDIMNNYFEVITFFDSLEHIEDIFWLNKLNCKLICISVPYCHWEELKVNRSEIEADHWFKNWKHRKPDEHLHHFSSRALMNYMAEMGYSVVSSSFIEDSIRKPENSLSNILTMVFKKAK